MNLNAIVSRMRGFPAVIEGLAGGLSIEYARWRPSDGAWSVLEIVNHLADEEAEDFRLRLQSTLADASKAWPGIDPEGVASKREYNKRELGESLARFRAEREASIAWLETLGSPDWRVAHRHPKLGEMSAGVLLASWAAHDALHVRQIAKRLFQLVERDAAGFSTRYAGEWRA